MVTKLTGRVNGCELIFERAYGNVWTGEVPKSPFYRYVVELEAWDDAGNMSFVTRMLFSVDPETLCVHMEPMNFGDGECIAPKFYSELLDITMTEVEFEGFSFEQTALVSCSNHYLEVLYPECSRRDFA